MAHMRPKYPAVTTEFIKNFHSILFVGTQWASNDAAGGRVNQNPKKY
jgi:hypothetical protein